jgi:PhzF family phenazine biosynthesis protein
MTRRHPLYIVDAFTSAPFQGNPAAVCLLRKEYPDSVLQSIAAEMNLSETAFVRAEGGDLFDSDRFSLRWFTPLVEAQLCGHATLAAAKVLYDELGVAAPSIAFDTRSGVLRVETRGGEHALDLPLNEPQPRPMLPGVERSLRGAVPSSLLEVDRYRLLVVRYDRLSDIESLQPDPAELVLSLPDHDIVVVTAPGTGPVDFVSRCFAPRLGIPEDPVTGLAHTALAPYWSREIGRPRLRAHQASRRGGDLTVELSGPDRVTLTGASRIVVRGYLDLPT